MYRVDSNLFFIFDKIFNFEHLFRVQPPKKFLEKKYFTKKIQINYFSSSCSDTLSFILFDRRVSL